VRGGGRPPLPNEGRGREPASRRAPSSRRSSRMDPTSSRIGYQMRCAKLTRKEVAAFYSRTTGGGTIISVVGDVSPVNRKRMRSPAVSGRRDGSCIPIPPDRPATPPPWPSNKPITRPTSCSPHGDCRDQSRLLIRSGHELHPWWWRLLVRLLDNIRTRPDLAYWWPAFSPRTRRWKLSGGDAAEKTLPRRTRSAARVRSSSEFAQSGRGDELNDARFT